MFYCRVGFHYMSLPQFVNTFTCRAYLGCFWCRAIWNRAALNILVRSHVFISLIKYLGIELLSCRDICLMFNKLPNTSAKRLSHFTLLHTQLCVSIAVGPCHKNVTIWCYQYFYFSYSDGYLMIFVCVSLMTKDIKHLFRWFWSFVFFCNMSKCFYIWYIEVPITSVPLKPPKQVQGL